MNYLAHAYLSFDDPGILVGNLVSDFVKGKSKFTYAPGIQKGIALHRAIDQFTDDHPITRTAKSFFRPAYRLYSGAFVDVVYDHFLALDTGRFSVYNGLEAFSKIVYRTLEDNYAQLPAIFQKIFPFMKTQNWLHNYQFTTGIRKSFEGLVRRAAYMTESETAFFVFKENYNELGACYNRFFPELKEFAAHYLRNL